MSDIAQGQTRQTYAIEDLGLLHDNGYHQFIGEIRGINALGEVIGDINPSTSSSEHHGFIYDGVMHDLGPIGGMYRTTIALAINDNSEIVGFHTASYAGDTEPPSAFLYNNVGTTIYDNLRSAYGINNNGQILGSPTGSGSTTEDPVLLNRNGTTINIGPIAWVGRHGVAAAQVLSTRLWFRSPTATPFARDKILPALFEKNFAREAFRGPT